MKTQQRGGTVIGLIIGMIVGLAAALAVAVYVTKVPVPFLSKGGKSGDQDAAEAQRNKNWDPNAPLQGRNPAPPPAAATPSLPGGETPAPAPAATPVPPAVAGGVTPPPAPAADPAKAGAKPADGKTSADPLGDLVKARSAAAEKAEKAEKAEASFNYFVQAGAFRSQGDADAQRAKLAMLGWEARVSEREQNGITIFRVRVGPFGKRDDAEQLKQKLDGAGVESTLVRAAR